VKEGLRRRSLMLVDLGVDLLVPPLSTLVLVSVGGAALAWGLTWLHEGGLALSTLP
jgi:hypothetical protein